MPGQARGSGAGCAPSGAITLLASAIGYTLGACVQVAPAEMALSTPCADWDLEALLAHLATSMADLESALRTGRLDLEPDDPATVYPDGDDPATAYSDGDDPATVYSDGDDLVTADLDGDDPVELLRDRAANLLFACYAHHGPGRFVLVGGLPLPAGIVACTGAVEIAVHGWDVCVARGHGDPIPPALATRMLRLSPLLVIGREGLFGTPVQVPAQASPGDQLVAYLGLRPAAPG